MNLSSLCPHCALIGQSLGCFAHIFQLQGVISANTLLLLLLYLPLYLCEIGIKILQETGPPCSSLQKHLESIQSGVHRALES